MLSDANLQILQKITTITDLAKVSLIKDTGNQGLEEVLKFRKITEGTRFFYCSKKNTSTNIATIKGIKNFQDLRAQQTSEIFFHHQKRNFIFPYGHVMFFLNYININEIKNFSNLIVFCCERREILRSQSNGDISRV